MRKTAAIRLTLLSAASLSLAGCGDDHTAQDTVFGTEAACIRAHGSDGEAACRESFRAARAEHEATAPRFADMAACEAETNGRCETTTARPGVAATVIPIMAGVLIGRALADASRPVMPVYGGRPGCPPGAAPTPECQQRSGSSSSTSSSGTSSAWYYAGNRVATSDTTGDARRAATTAAGATTLARVGTAGTVTRGGLGAAGRGFSSASS